MITVQRAPAYATVQDLGRHGFRSSGVPWAGAMDPFALVTANMLTGNARDAAGLELAITGGTFSFGAPASFALAGANAKATLGERELELYRLYRASAGEALTIHSISNGRFLYIALAGGIDADHVLGSASTYVPGGFGGHRGRRLETGDELRPGSRQAARKHDITDSLPQALRPPARRDDIHFIPRSSDAVREIAGPYVLSSSADRSGYRLGGHARAGGGSITSEPVGPGVIQLPPGGEPIVLMADAPTVGGYRIMGGVISAHLGVLAQKLPGDSVELVPTTIDRARRELEKLAEVETLVGEWCLG